MNSPTSIEHSQNTSVIDTAYEEQLELRYCYSDEFEAQYAAHQSEISQDVLDIDLDSLPY